MNDILLIGPQGSGKGTQSVLLSVATGLPHVSMGALLRSEVERETEAGKEMKAIIARGDIVPSAFTERILKDRLAQPDAAQGVLLDGFPRTPPQADMLDRVLGELGRRINHAIFLDITDETAYERLGGRLVCTNKSCERNYHVTQHPPKVAGVCDVCGSAVARRADDTPEAIHNRLAIFHAETKPLIVRYRAQGVLTEIDGHLPIPEVHALIMKAVGK